jgi:hypothetical protein
VRGEAHGGISNIEADRISDADEKGDGVWRSQEIVEVPVSPKCPPPCCHINTKYISLTSCNLSVTYILIKVIDIGSAASLSFPLMGVIIW